MLAVKEVIFKTLLFPLYYLCCCCFCCGLRPFSKVGRWFGRYRGSPPTPLPARRQRTLTLPLPPKTLNVFSTVQKTRDQHQSSLFIKLPLEIRMRIYEKALNGDGFPLHLFRQVPQCISHVRCDRTDGKCYRYNCFQQRRKAGLGERANVYPSFKTQGGLLPLLLSCRKM